MKPLQSLVAVGVWVGLWTLAQAADPVAAVGLGMTSLSAEDQEDIAAVLGVRAGMLVTAVQPDSAAQRCGFRKGDVVLTLGEKPVASLADVARILQAASGQLAVVAMRPGDDEDYLPVNLVLTLPAAAIPPPPPEDSAAASPPSAGTDPEAARKLQALESARAAGVLTDEEFDRKRREITAAQPSTPASTPPAEGTEIANPAWPFVFRAPPGWQCRQDANGAILGHDTIPGMILVLPHGETSLEALRAQMQQGLQDDGCAINLTGPLKADGPSRLVGECGGRAGEQAVKGMVIGVLGPRGGGACVIALSSPEGLGRELPEAGRRVGASVSFPAPPAGGGGSELLRHFAGTWVTMTTNTQTTITLRPDGTFHYGYESSYSGDFRGGGGEDLGNWGAANQESKRGRWTPQGTREKGVFAITNQDGSRETVPYQVHVENGQVYWNEYTINGALYGRQR